MARGPGLQNLIKQLEEECADIALECFYTRRELEKVRQEIAET
jgi:hypothetical protein